MISFLVNIFCTYCSNFEPNRLNTCACNSKPTLWGEGGGFFATCETPKSLQTPSGYQGHIQNMDTYPGLFHVLYTRYIKVYHTGLSIHAKYSTARAQKRAQFLYTYLHI